MNRLKRAKILLEQHFEQHTSINKEEYQELLNLFPDFVEEVIAYRIIKLSPDNPLDLNRLQAPFHSWTMKEDCLQQFAKYEWADGVDSDVTFSVYSAKVLGLNIYKIVEELVLIGTMAPDSSEKYFREQEIVAIEVSELVLIDSTYKLNHI